MHKRPIPSLFHQLASTENIIGVGYGYKLVRSSDTGIDAVVVLVRKKKPHHMLIRHEVIPRRIDGRPTDVIEVGDIRLLNERTTMLRPAIPGVSIGHSRVSAGTLGAVIRDRDTGEWLILSNNHVLANGSDGTDGRCQMGDEILQPGPFDGGDSSAIIGHLYRFAPLYRHTSAPSCPVAHVFESLLNRCIHFIRPAYRVQILRQNGLANTVDCALARPVNDADILPDIMGIGAVRNITEAEPGTSVRKSGRSTGVTQGIVLATDVTVRVEVGSSEYVVFTDQVLATPMSVPGDSGSLIVTEENQAVGLLFAGSEKVTLFNRIQNVCAALNVRF